ncbi:putative sodium-dependent multivitamin transporter [Calliopsis andreniformis]|uniref:putative sodium-dependent multivitamin transporter n=1 Tax=Calliopsis andreniformis TaxID=337506 RepID=UPI003FCC59A5
MHPDTKLSTYILPPREPTTLSEKKIARFAEGLEIQLARGKPEQTKSTSVSTLQWSDYLVIGVMLSISAGIGLYYRFTGGRQRTAEEYFSANKSMGIVPLAIALTVSFVSAITLLGISAENYTHGTQILLFYLGGVIGTPIAVQFYLPVFAKLNSMSVYEYLEKRFSVTARLVTSTANFLQLMLYTGIVLFAPSLALEATTGLSVDMSVLLIGLICTFYSTSGGIKAVLITDVFQGILMFVGIGCILFIANADIDGGLSNVWSLAQKTGRIDFFDFRLDPTIRHTWWSLMIGGTCIFLSLYAVNQVQVQRLLTAKDFKSSQYALFLSGPITISLAALTSYSGLVLYAVYKDCDPLTSGQIDGADKIMPFFAAERMSRIPGLTGLFISGVFSASLSTISAMVNSLAAVALEDYVKPSYKKLGLHFPTEKESLLGKVLTGVNGLICLALAFIAKSMGGLVEATISLSGAISGPILGIFTLGMFVESANDIGAVAGIISSLIICLWAFFGRHNIVTPNLPLSVEGCDNSTLSMDISRVIDDSDLDNSSYFYLYRLSYMWYCPLGMVVTLVVGSLVSLATNRIFRKDTRELDPDLFIPMLAARIKRRRENVAKTTSSQVFMLDSVK